jgi:hypothetical protein
MHICVCKVPSDRNTELFMTQLFVLPFGTSDSAWLRYVLMDRRLHVNADAIESCSNHHHVDCNALLQQEVACES